MEGAGPGGQQQQDSMLPPLPRLPPKRAGPRGTAAAHAAGVMPPPAACFPDTSPAGGLEALQPPGSAPAGPPLPLPTPWSAYFDSQRSVHCPERVATFNVYLAGSTGPVVLCLHGGGYTGLTWALMAQHLKDRCRVVAPDLRAHGLTQTDNDSDFSAATLAADVAAMWKALFLPGGSSSRAGGLMDGGSGSRAGGLMDGGSGSPVTSSSSSSAQPPPTVLVGHSMGGAIAVHAAALKEIPSLAGLVVIDVVEGTAISSLPHMAAVLQRRPPQFPSLQAAVDWAMESGMCRSVAAAHVSLPAMLRLATEAAAAAGAGGSAFYQAAGSGAQGLGAIPEGSESEEGEGAEHSDSSNLAANTAPALRPAADSSYAQPLSSTVNTSSSASSTAWVWRTPLQESAPAWEGWYLGLSDLFLSLTLPKVLVLAGTDRLDKALTIGQMQGKFQLVLLPQAGHAVHEDEHERTAEAISHFLRRFRVGEAPLAIPRPAPGLPRVLPVAAGPSLSQQQQQQQQEQ